MQNGKRPEALGLYVDEEIQGDTHLVEVFRSAEHQIEEPIITLQGLRRVVEHHKKGTLTLLGTATGAVGFALAAHRAANRETQIII